MIAMDLVVFAVGVLRRPGDCMVRIHLSEGHHKTEGEGQAENSGCEAGLPFRRSASHVPLFFMRGYSVFLV